MLFRSKEAAVEGAKLRFRPIQMTSFAFIAGLLPLVVATGAGAIGNRTIGTTGAGGMLFGTVIGVLVIPGLYYLFGRIADGRSLISQEADQPLSEVFEHQAQEAHDGESVRDRKRNGLPLPCETAESPASLLSTPVLRRPFPLEIPESAEEKSTIEIPESVEEKPTTENPESAEEESMIGP